MWYNQNTMQRITKCNLCFIFPLLIYFFICTLDLVVHIMERIRTNLDVCTKCEKCKEIHVNRYLVFWFLLEIDLFNSLLIMVDENSVGTQVIQCGCILHTFATIAN